MTRSADPVPTLSRPCPGQGSIPTETTLSHPVPDPPYGGRGGTGSAGGGRPRDMVDPVPVPLPLWLASLRERQIALRVTPRGVDSTPPGQLDADDRVVAFRHRWALEQARTHLDWWNAVIGRTDRRGIGMRHIPTSPHAKKGDAFGCAACGAAGLWLDEHLLAWCRKHKRWSADRNINNEVL